MGKKFLAEFRSDPVLNECVNEIHRTGDEGFKQIQFLMKRAEQLARELKKSQMPTWHRMGHRLVELGKLKEYKEGTDANPGTGLSFDRDDGVIWLVEADDNNSMKHLLKHLLD